MSHFTEVLIVFLVLAGIAPKLGDRYFSRAEKLLREFASHKRLAVVAVASAAIVLRLAILWLYPIPVPDVHDEFSYLLASDTFAHGRLTNPPHPMWIFFDTFHVLQHPTYMSIFPPAQGMALAIGQHLGHPWVGVLLSMALMCGAITWMLQGWFPPEWALLGGSLVLLRLGLISYWINSYWGGALAAAGGALMLGAFPRILHHCRTRDAFVFGSGAALLANSRPVEGFLLCIPVAIALAMWLFPKASSPLGIAAGGIIVPLACILAATLAFMGYYNWRITGNVFLLPHALSLQQQCNCPIFSWQKSKPPLHYLNPQFNQFFNVDLRNRYIPSWPAWWHRSWGKVVDLWHFFLNLVLSVPFITLPWVVRDRRMRLLLFQFFLGAAGLLAVAYIEPHYAAPLVATVLAIWVQAMRHLRRWRLLGRPIGTGLTRAVVLLALANLTLYAALSTHAAQSQEVPWNIYRSRIATQLDAAPGLHLVIVHYAPDHSPHHEWVYNRADIDNSKIVWAREIPKQNMQPLLMYFHDRSVWLVEADASPPRITPYSGQQGDASGLE